MTTTEVANNTVGKLRLHQNDTGSPQVQVALLTERISQLSNHLRSHTKDHHSRLGLLKLVGRRRRLLEYLKRHDEDTYRKTLDTLKLRK